MLRKICLWICLFSAATGTLAAQAEVIEERAPVVILGGGVAALTSAVYLAQAGILPTVITGSILGGAITQSHLVQNWPGEMQIKGIELAERISFQAVENGALLFVEEVIDVDFSIRPFLITTQKNNPNGKQIRKIRAEACIIALGSTPRFLDVPGEKKYWSRGVYSCAVCDGILYKNGQVAVVGGGDSALTEAQYLSNIASHVYLIVRSDQFRSIEKRRLDEVLSKQNIEVLYRSEVKEIGGDDAGVTHIVLENNADGKRRQLTVDALFLGIGATPNTSLFQGKLPLDERGYIILKNHQETSIPGVYAVGDVADSEFKQAVSAAGDGAKAAMQAQKHLTHFQPKELIASSQKAPQKKLLLEVKNQEELQKLLSESEVPLMLDFYGDFCGPCRMFSPMYEAWAKEFQGKILFVKVDVEKAQSLCQAYQIRGIPTVVILDKEGKLISKNCGSLEIAQIDQQLQKMKNSDKIDAQNFKR